jgi:hypothetical protein
MRCLHGVPRSRSRVCPVARVPPTGGFAVGHGRLPARSFRQQSTGPTLDEPPPLSHSSRLHESRWGFEHGRHLAELLSGPQLLRVHMKLSPDESSRDSMSCNRPYVPLAAGP